MTVERRLTLVELMVAVVLATILIGVITFVWTQSNQIFATTVHRLETYQRLRCVLDVIERDLANTNRTVNMEFFVDKTTNPNGEGQGYYDPTDSLQTVGTQHFRLPRDPLDPVVVKGQGEFGLTGFDETSVPYLYAPTLLSPPPYKVGGGYTDNRFYWQDEVYVRTFAQVDGINRPALVHYRLVRSDDGRSVLRRRVWFLNDAQKIDAPAPGVAGTDRTTVLATGICDLKVGFFFKANTSEKDGDWYHVGQESTTVADQNEDEPALKRGSGLLKADEARGFLRARAAPPQGLSSQHVDQFGGLNALSFVYSGNARFEQTTILPPVLRGLKGDAGTNLASMPLMASADLQHYSNFDFPGVRPGDKFLIYEATDDDDKQTPVVTNRQAGQYFPGQLFTVDTIFSQRQDGNDYIAVRFREPIDFYRQIETWLGDEPDLTVNATDLGANPLAGPAPVGTGRPITASFNVRYRVGFLPAAFLIRLSSDDRHNNKVLPMERVIRLVQQ